MLHVQHPPSPNCLSNYRHGRDQWGSLSTADLAHLHTLLLQAQNSRCAYCEAPVDNSAHIDHFIQRSQSPQLTFIWSNMLRSCTKPGKQGCCGKFKDEQVYQHILNPTLGHTFTHLAFGKDGFVTGRTALGEETIRVLNLNHSDLVQRRLNALRGITQEPFGSLIGEPGFEEVVDQEVAAQLGQPFESTLIAYLTGA